MGISEYLCSYNNLISTTTATTLTTSDSTAMFTDSKAGFKIVRQRIQIHRIISWALVVFSLITIILGYAIARNWTPDLHM